ncbi:MAG: beta-ketoacyl-ACP synthase II [Oligoflexia bacterium]|nr:beta-ketoacyl-ACP synthase II [Oligoflexia bacterium]MBF0364475.1 beta-ketoacyl-ACP synthase II [Oligoflexia bacterium]
MRRVVITGMSAICGNGHTLDEVWKNCIDGKSGISSLTKIDISNFPIQFAGEVKNFKIAPELIEEKDHKRYDTFVHYALHSAHLALGDAKLLSENSCNFLKDLYHPTKVGCILGVGMGGFPMIEQNHSAFLSGGHRKVSPVFIPAVIPNMASGIVTIKYGLRGINYSVSSACASSAHAILTAANEIRFGNVDCMVTGGAEAVLTYLPIAGFVNMKALSKRNDAPQKASRPFDIDRDGFVIGEGAAILVLEEREQAIKRGAHIYAELVGAGATSDAYHITAPHPEGEGAILCMQQAITSAGISPDEIDYINAHGTSTPLGDIAETLAIKKVFGERAIKQEIAVSATKSMIGHLLGAAGAIESVFCIKALETGIIPPTINLDKQDPECDLYYVPNEAIKRPIRYALNNSFGFGGTNACLIFKREG